MSVRDILKFSYRCLSRESPGTSCFRHYLDNISDALLPSNLVCVTDNSLLGTVYPFEALRHLTKDTKLHIAFCFHIKLTLETEFHLLLYCFLVYSNGVPQSPHVQFDALFRGEDAWNVWRKVPIVTGISEHFSYRRSPSFFRPHSKVKMLHVLGQQEDYNNGKSEKKVSKFAIITVSWKDRKCAYFALRGAWLFSKI